MNQLKTRFLFLSLLIFLSVRPPAWSQSAQWYNYDSGLGIMDFEFDGSDIWITTYGGLVKLNRNTGTHINYNGGVYGLVKNQLYQITTDKYNHLFITGSSDFVQTYDKNASWSYFDSIPSLALDVEVMNNAVSDDLGNVYSCSGVSSFVMKYNAGIWDTLDLPFTGNAVISGLAVDSSNHLWVATRHAGVAVHDGSSWTVYDSTNSILPSQYLNGIGIDPVNNKIYCLYYLVPTQATFFTFDNGVWAQDTVSFACTNAAVDLHVDSAHNVWVTGSSGALSGIVKYDGSTTTFFGPGVFGLPNGEITEFKIDGQGVWWYACKAGFYSYDGVSHKRFELANSGIPNSTSINRIVVDKYNAKWIAGYYGISRFDGISWQHFYAGVNGLGYTNINDILADDDHGLIWAGFNAGSASAGVAYYDGISWTMLLPAQTNGFYGTKNILKDAYGNLWFQGMDGIAKYDHSTWTYYTNIPGYSSGNTYSMAADSLGNIFLAAYTAGIYKFDGTTWQLFGPSYFNNATNFSVVLSGPGGTIYATTGGNVHYFDGTNWNVFASPCLVNIPNTYALAKSTEPELWLSNYTRASKFDGTGCNEFTCSQLPDLSGLVKSVAKDKFGNYWFSYSVSGGVSVYNPEGITLESLQATSPNNISGFAFVDINSDGVYDSLVDAPRRQQMILLLPDSSIRYTDGNGMYNFTVDTGSYTVRVVPTGTWQLTTDSLEYHVYVTSGDTSGLDFGLMDPFIPIDSMEVNITHGIPRCVIPFPVWINYTNHGLMDQSGLIKFTSDTALDFGWSQPPPDSISGDEYFWNVSNLGYLQTQTIQVNVSSDVVFPLPVHQVEAEFTGLSTVLASQALTIQQLCSYDPNDKSVSPAGTGALNEIAPGQQLTYTIRFQNYGNDTAFTVMIIDTLDVSLDINSFAFAGSSHACQVSISHDRVLKVVFNNINLLWESVNVAGSQGYFQYRILPLQNLPDSTAITNQASIFFDLNAPIVTNQTLNTVIYSTVFISEIQNRDQLKVYPNPAGDHLFVDQSDNGDTAHEFVIYDVMGVMKRRGFITENRIDLTGLSKQVYILTIVSGTRSYNIRLVKM